ncbi:unnamed protein product [Euphydryas editha]|uniref:Uncharacterized protein n=1 Tax=Euphydryas editha TaxID=104508 RepID=A0AAU9V6T4_EUPED|nr:unnamed protein product [Euphydryas editha]
MVKINVLLFTCLVIIAVATAKPLSDEESPQPSTKHDIVEGKARPKRCLSCLYEMTIQAIAESMVDIMARQGLLYPRNTVHIGNGNNNHNNVNFDYNYG